MQKRSSALFVLMVILAVHASSTAVCGSNTVYNFLRLDVSSRAAALAGSFVSVTEDPNTIFYNPAGLSTLSTPMGSVGFFKHLLDINSGYLSYSREVEDIGHFGVGAVFTHYGSFDRTDDLANTLGTFSPSWSKPEVYPFLPCGVRLLCARGGCWRALSYP
jgi:hypothetical protein